MNSVKNQPDSNKFAIGAVPAYQSATRLLIVSLVPARLDTNFYLRDYLREGFAAVLGDENVACLGRAQAVTKIRELLPNVVLVCGSCYSEDFYIAPLRHACDEVGALLVYWTFQDPNEFDSHAKLLSFCDHIFTNDRWASLHYDRDDVWHLPPAASMTGLPPDTIDEAGKCYDLFFCGVAYPNRQRLVRDLAGILGRVNTRVCGPGWQEIGLPFCDSESIPHDQLAVHHSKARIILNLGGALERSNDRYRLSPSTPGPRTFEAAAAGACQMFFADSLEIMDYFNLNEEIVLFDGPDDFEEKFLALLRDPARRKRIGEAAQQRCLREHTYKHRAWQLLADIGVLNPSVNGESSIRSQLAPTETRRAA
jgi:spore maturation protein CgeB